MHLLNKNPSPQDRGDKGALVADHSLEQGANQTTLDSTNGLFAHKMKLDSYLEQSYKFPDLVIYALVILFLTAIFFTFQSFSSKVFSHQISWTSGLVKQGGEVVEQNIGIKLPVVAKKLTVLSDDNITIVKLHWSKFFSEQVALAHQQKLIFKNGFYWFRHNLGSLAEESIFGIQTVKDTVGGIGETGNEFLLGVGRGITLFSNNLIFSGHLATNMVGQGFYNARQSIYSTLYSANTKIAKVEKKVARNMDTWQTQNIQAGLFAQKIMQISSATASYQKTPSTASTSVATSTEQGFYTDWLTWSNWLAKPGFIPIVSAAYEKKVLPLRNSLNVGILAIADMNSSLMNNVYLTWNKFFNQLFGRNNVTKDLSNASLWEQLKKEMLQELQKNNTITTKDGSADSMYTDIGIVLMKSSDSIPVDLNNVKKIQDSFSDRVLVNFNQAGDTGVIQPIFRDRLGEKYIFVITPIKK